MRFSATGLRLALTTLVVGSGLQLASAQEGQPADDSKPAVNSNDSSKPAEPKKDSPKSKPNDPVVPAPGDGLVPNKPAFFMNLAVNKANGKYGQGERLSVRFKSERDSHVYLLYHQADGSAVMIFPNKVQTNNLVKAKEEVSIPKAGDSFLFRVSAPFGDEALQVIASEEPIEMLDKLDASAGRAVAVPKQTLGDLADLVKKSPGKFGEHRAVIHTFAGAGPLPEPRKPARFGIVFTVPKGHDDPPEKVLDIARRGGELVEQALLGPGGIPSENLRVMTDEQSTSGAFEEAITKWLPSVSQPGDTIVIFYCGHGVQVPARDESEPDGYDEVLTTYNYDRKNPYDTGILDDHLARWLQELPGRQIAMIMETCHGGGLVDGTGMSSLMRDDAKRCHDISNLNTAIVTACLPEEYSRFYKNDPASFMPWLFVEAMQKLPKPVSFNQAFGYYRERLPKVLARGQNVPDYSQVPSFTDFCLLPIVLVPADSNSTAPAGQ